MSSYQKVNNYHLIIGLEIHAELKTRTKMFCNSANDPRAARPNVNVCPICLAHPGTLPTINKAAVESVIRLGLAAGGEIANFTEFDRKNYFYPDLPKGYQISQYEHPIVSGGILNKVPITRVHLEEDTARSIHDQKTGESLIDFNRAGVPLMELVTEPVITSARQAADFARELQLLLLALDISEANMELGQMRVEANVSVSQKSKVKSQKLGTKVEVKNLNSFRAAERAIEYEFKRQVELLEHGESVIQETRGWDEVKGQTFSQREKESSHDYRYFPEPDLPKLYLHEIFDLVEMKKTLPELPWEKRARYAKDYGIKAEDIEAYVTDKTLGEFFEAAALFLDGDQSLIRLASNYISNDLVNQLIVQLGGLASKLEVGRPKLPAADNFAELIKMTARGEISSRGAKDILAIMVKTGGGPRAIAESNNLLQRNDESHLGEIVEKIIAAHPQVIADFKAGKQSALQFLIGQGMKETKGAANPQVLDKLIRARL